MTDPTTPEDRAAWLADYPSLSHAGSIMRRLIADVERLTKERDGARAEIAEFQMIASNQEAAMNVGDADYLVLRDEADKFRMERDEARREAEHFRKFSPSLVVFSWED